MTVNDPYGNPPPRTHVHHWRDEDRDKLKTAVALLAALTLVSVLVLIVQVVGVSGGKKEADETQRLLRDVQQAIAANPHNPSAPLAEEPKK
jgi:hypothetical protein